MNTFVAKKLGEVWAFSRVGMELVEKGEAAAVEALGGKDSAMAFVQALKGFGEDAKNTGDDTTAQKAEATTEKLRGMMEAYIKDEWDNPVELLEWLSFFLGSAAAHWSLIKGAGKGIGDQALTDTAASAVDFYNLKLDEVQVELAKLGEVKSQE